MPSQPASIGLMTILAAVLVAAAPEAQGMKTVDPPRWFRGNTHTHSLNSDGDSTTPVHANGLGLMTVVMPRTGESPLDVLQKDVAAIREAGALPQINHPNFGWALTAACSAKSPSRRPSTRSRATNSTFARASSSPTARWRGLSPSF